MKIRALLLLLMLTLVPFYAAARPGGGQSYHAAPSHSSVWRWGRSPSFLATP